MTLIWSYSNALEEKYLHLDSEYECFFNETAWEMTSSQLVGRTFIINDLGYFYPENWKRKLCSSWFWGENPLTGHLIYANQLVGYWKHSCDQDRQGPYLWGGCTLVDQDRYWTRKQNCDGAEEQATVKHGMGGPMAERHSSSWLVVGWIMAPKATSVS